jgi:hypothetical protein
VLHRVALALSHSLAFSDVMDALALELTLAIERACECTISVWRPEADALEVASVYLIDGGISEQLRGERYPLADYPASRELLEAGTGHVQQRATDPGFRRTGDALRSVCRAGDVAARLGGDEFALILHGCADPGAAARRVLAAARRKAGVSVSIGATTASGTSISTMQQADQSLLAAKQAGKRTFQIAS